MARLVTLQLPEDVVAEGPLLEAIADVKAAVGRIQDAVLSGRIAYTYKEAAQVVGLSPRFLQEEVRTGRLPAKMAGGRRIIGHTDLLEWFERLPDAADRKMPLGFGGSPSRAANRVARAGGDV